jgi:hypothetical protein
MRREGCSPRETVTIFIMFLKGAFQLSVEILDFIGDEFQVP